MFAIGGRAFTASSETFKQLAPLMSLSRLLSRLIMLDWNDHIGLVEI